MTPRPLLIGGKPAEQGSCVVPLITRLGRTPLARSHSSPSTPHSLALRKHMPTKGPSSLITDFRYSAGPMLDLGYVREHMDAIEKTARDRGVTLDLDGFRELDSERRQIITSIERLKAERNKASEEIARLKRKGSSAPNVTSTSEGDELARILEKMKTVSDEIKPGDERIAELDGRLR